MSRRPRTLTTAVAGLALASLPLLVDAQSTSTQSTQQTPRQTTGSARGGRSTDSKSAQHHLDEAKRVLSGINHRTLKGQAATQITQVKRHFNQLETAWRTSSAGAARSGAARSTTEHTTHTTTGTAGTTAGAMAGSGDWMTHYTAITGLLDQLGATSTGTSGEVGTTGAATGAATGSTTGSTAGAATGGTSDSSAGRTGSSARGSVTLDERTRTKLVEFRRHLDLFHESAMTQQGGRGEEDQASAAPESGVTGSRTGTTASGTTASQPYPPTGAPESTASATGTTPQPPTSATTQTEQTQTTTGQASASASVDAARVARLTASIDELLQGSAATSTAAGTTTGTPTGTTSSTAGTTGAVGTSGTASSTSTVCVDRAKLEQLKRDIQALQGPPR